MPRTKSTPTTEQKIEARAHEIWLREGRPEGRHLTHWQQAEAEIAAETKPGATPTRARTAANRNRRKDAAAE